jgi:hypothetical protein
MNKPAMDCAKQKAKELLIRVGEMELKLRKDENAWFGCPESGALRRASLDLTRALARLRRPG